MKTFTDEEYDAAYEAHKDQIRAAKKQLVEDEKRKKSLFDIGPERDQEIADAVKRLFERRKATRKTNAEQPAESTKEFLETHKEEAEKGQCEPYESILN